LPKVVTNQSDLYIIGIILGIANSCAYVMDSEKSKFMETPERKRTIPSVVVIALKMLKLLLGKP